MDGGHEYEVVREDILTARALLSEVSNPSDDEIRHALAGNLCRCGSYVKIVNAVRLAAIAINR